MIKLYNSLSKQIEILTPQQENKYRIYSCGPTVYNYLHIGNLTSFIYADTLRRMIQFGTNDQYSVEHVMNITDVDDKTIRDSQQEYPDSEPMQALMQLTDKYTNIFLHDIARVGVDTSQIKFIKATDSIEAMQTLIIKLLDHKIAYVAEDGIYFSIENYRAKGKVYGQLVQLENSEKLQARIVHDDYDKESAQDFALWKFQTDREPAWDFWYKDSNYCGRPGWHIECSAMSEISLGIPFDIHTGGIDLKFPHHENEIAQSTAVNGDIMAKLFFHNEHLLVDGAKMSKSKNNFYTLKDIEEKGIHPMAFRLATLESSYDTQANYTTEKLQAANNRLLRWANSYFLSKQQTYNASKNTTEERLIQIVDKFDQSISAALRDNLNTVQAISIIDEYLDILLEHQISLYDGRYMEQFVQIIKNLLGIEIAEVLPMPDLNVLDQLLLARNSARQQKNWPEADRIRGELHNMNLNILDTADGQVWQYTKI